MEQLLHYWPFLVGIIVALAWCVRIHVRVSALEMDKEHRTDAK